jgi:hypothetical protein
MLALGAAARPLHVESGLHVGIGRGRERAHRIEDPEAGRVELGKMVHPGEGGEIAAQGGRPEGIHDDDGLSLSQEPLAVVGGEPIGGLQLNGCPFIASW